MGIRTLLVLIAIALLIWAGKRWWANRRVAPTRSRHAPRPMLRCDYCGLHVPAEEAIRDQTGDFCCPEHRHAASSGPGQDP